MKQVVIYKDFSQGTLNNFLRIVSCVVCSYIIYVTIVIFYWGKSTRLVNTTFKIAERRLHLMSVNGITFTIVSNFTVLISIKSFIIVLISAQCQKVKKVGFNFSKNM
jgi:hypothetical protein